MKYVNPEEFIETEFSEKVQRKFYRAISSAYANSLKIIEKHPGLNWMIGKEILPHIKRVLIEYELQEMCKSNILPYDFRTASNKSDNCLHLEIRASNSILTVSYVSREKSMPRDAIFREDLGIFNNQTSMFDSEKELNGPYHLLLTHGTRGEKPKFVYIGMPNTDARSWMANIPIHKKTFDVIHEQDTVTEVEHDYDLDVREEYLVKQGVLNSEE